MQEPTSSGISIGILIGGVGVLICALIGYRIGYREKWHARKGALQMNWTTEYPTKPGFYWIRNYAAIGVPETEPEPAVVHVVGEWIGDLEFYFPGNASSWAEEELGSAEWYGPIEPPE